VSSQTGRYSGLPTGGRPPLPPEVRNGRIPLSLLGRCRTQEHLALPYLYAPAAEAFDAMVDAAGRDGITLQAVALYRDYAGQVREREEWTRKGKPENAAVPGRSNHGWATAADINRHLPGVLAWLVKNGPRFGFDHPLWAGSPSGPEFGREPWHWQFIVGFRLEGEGEDMERVKVAVNGVPQGDVIDVRLLDTGDGPHAYMRVEDWLRFAGYAPATWDPKTRTVSFSTAKVNEPEPPLFAAPPRVQGKGGE
jgi:hypothetical protein